ncbi:hypothetical protein CBR_g39705 [Chara braunii]|uniref:Uncharacterized protein n=1 Tax=Chara braunii TaxID=69332 RepID=A0A388LSB7_CHABU|nr:hypothetical protein CBR_g39705 [Chara braunii]|eukprot:GBG85139.1 hypothetical protein CBR_g39705 [Chara braunii]
MSMSVAQVQAALAEVMKYAKEGVHYDNDNEFSLLEDRVPRCFIVNVDMRSTMMANGEGCVKAQTLLQRFRESPHIRVDSDVEDRAYSLKGVVQWMCSEGMCEEGDVDMTMLQKGGRYTPSDFKKLLGTSAKNSEMVVDGSKDELKNGASRILVFSRMKDITQTPPEDFQDVPVIVADGVEYVLLDQLVDFMKNSPNDRNVIHEALHEVTELTLQGQELIEYMPARKEDIMICGIPLWEGMLYAALEQLGHAGCDVDRQRKKEEGWKSMVRETNLAMISHNGQTSAAQETMNSMSVVVPPMQTTTTEEIEEETMFNGFTMGEQQRDRGFQDPELPSCIAEYTGNAEEEDEEEDDGASSSEVEVSDNDVSSDEEGEERDVYYDLKGASGQVTKGWAHAILRLARAFPDLQKVLRVMMKGAIPDGGLHDIENRPLKTQEKRSQKEKTPKQDHRTKKRITYKKDKIVETIDLRGSGDLHNVVQEEAEDEDEQSKSEKTDGEEDEAMSDEGSDSETSGGDSHDVDDTDDDKDRSSDGTAQDEDDEEADEDGRMRAEMKDDKTWRRSGDDSWGAPAFNTTLTKVFQMRRDDTNLGVMLQQLTFTEMVLQCEIEKTAKTNRAADQIQKLTCIKHDIASSVHSRDTVMSFSIFKLDRAASVSEKAVALSRVGLPSVHRSGPHNITITDDDLSLEFIAPPRERRKDGERDRESLCPRP